MKAGTRVSYHPHGSTQQSREWVGKVGTVKTLDRHDAQPGLTPVEFDHAPHQVMYVRTGDLSVLR